jgi:hypothetical protein
MTIIFYTIIYVIGYLVSVFAMHKFHKQLEMDYNVPKTYSNQDDWDNNAQAFAGISLVWFMFWGMFGFLYLVKKLIKFSSNIEKRINNQNKIKKEVEELQKHQELFSDKIDGFAKEFTILKETLVEQTIEHNKLKKENSDLLDSQLKRNQWLDNAKRDSGFPISMSFDDVWKQLLTFYKENNK